MYKVLNKAKVVLIVLFCVCFLLGGSLLIASCTDGGQKTTELSEDDKDILRYYREATIDDDFHDNEISVILKSAYDDLEEIGFNDFKIVEKVSKIVAIKYNLEQFTRGSKEKFKLEEGKNHMFRLELEAHSKEKVLEAISQLKKLDMVLVAEPIYIYDIVFD